MTTSTHHGAGPHLPFRRRFFLSCNAASNQHMPCTIFYGPAALVRIQRHLDGLERIAVKGRKIREEKDATFVRSRPFIPSAEARESSAHRIVVRLNNRARSLNSKLAVSPPFTRVVPLYSLQTYKAIPDFPRTSAEINDLPAAQLTRMLDQLGKEAPKGLTPKRLAFCRAIGALPEVTPAEN